MAYIEVMVLWTGSIAECDEIVWVQFQLWIGMIREDMVHFEVRGVATGGTRRVGRQESLAQGRPLGRPTLEQLSLALGHILQVGDEAHCSGEPFFW